MAIITISRGGYSQGKDVAELVARELGYECVSREILLEASENFNIPEIKLERALHDAPSILQRFTYGREKYLAYITEAFLEHVHRDKVVYHGLAGHFLLRGVSHVLKVRILAELEDRVALEMKREQISCSEAETRLKKDDQERRQWSLKIHGVDTWDPSLYDLVVHVHKLKAADAARLICEAAQLEQFEATPESLAVLNDLLLAARVKARLVNEYPGVAVSSAAGVVTVDIHFNVGTESGLVEQIKEAVLAVPGVKEVLTHQHPRVIY